MACISSFGVYIPYYRLKREDVGIAWRQGAGAGERAVANYDEDALTMGVEAGFHALDGLDEKPDVLFFATTTSPYDEKQIAAIAACALDLPRDALTVDFGGSLRAATSALIAASHAVDSGRHKSVLVIASDTRPAMPASTNELSFGDAACAFIVKAGKGALTLSDYYAVNDETLFAWRLRGDKFVNMWEDRFIKQENYLRVLKEAVGGLLKKTGLASKDVSKFSAYAPDSRSLGEAAKTLGFDPAKQVADPLFGSVGECGVASVVLGLVVSALSASSGDKLIAAGFGDGCDAFLFVAGEGVDSILHGPSIKVQLESKAYLSYVDYLRFRRLVLNQITDIPQGVSSAPISWRDRDALLKFFAHRCNKCGTVHYPLERVCYKCLAKDDFTEIPLARAGGRLFTFTKDNLFTCEDPPQVMAVVESAQGVRLYLQMTDRDPEKIELNMPLEFTLRYLHDGSGFRNYFWKCRPARFSSAKEV